MAYRNLYITQPSTLRIANDNLQVEQDGRTVSLPVEDILSVMIEDRGTMISSYAVSLLAQHDVMVFWCDRLHLPTAVSLPICTGTRRLRRLEQQIALTEPTKKRLWQKIVIAKIKNQALSLRFNNKLEKANYLDNVANNVLSGDTDNREGHAASVYFKSLFGTGFVRQADDWVNAALNYGYAIVRGIVARSLVAHGFVPELGIHHHNEFNNFNLADDIIEPFRPLVDMAVATHSNDNKDIKTLTTQHKAYLYDIINYQMLWQDKRQSVATCIEDTVSTLTKCYETGLYDSLTLPVLVPLQRHVV